MRRALAIFALALALGVVGLIILEGRYAAIDKVHVQ